MLRSLGFEAAKKSWRRNSKSREMCKLYREALRVYTQGVGAKVDDGRLRDALFLNRAACNLELRAPLAFPCPTFSISPYF